VSNRTKGVPADPDAERRALARELNEATKDARAAARDLREARDSVGATAKATVEELVESFVNEAVTKINEHIRESEDTIVESLDKAQQATEARIANMMGLTTMEEVMVMLSKTFMKSVHSQDFITILAAHMATHIRTEILEELNAGEGAGR
jgi:vacuolar-type H+-ATPase subunit H